MAEDARNSGETSGAEQAAPAPAPAAVPATPEPASAPATEDGDGKLDPQLIGMAVVLWLLAVAIFAFKWDRLRVDWYLGNIKETGDLSKKLDEPSMEALAGLAQGDADVVRMVGEEVVGPLANADPFYRVALVRTLERVPGPAALEVVTQAALTDVHAVVRANAYQSLKQRAHKDQAERPQAVKVIVAALSGEPEPMARAFAIDVAAELDAKEALWPVIRGVREARGTAPAVDRDAANAGEKAVREKGAAAFYKLSGASKDQLPFDAEADLATRDAQVRAWEAWFKDKGNPIPKGESFDEAHPAPASSTPPGPAPPASTPEGQSQ